MNKFKTGDKVVVATMEDLPDYESANWALRGNLETNKEYTVETNKLCSVEYSEVGFIRLIGEKFWHPEERFKPSTPINNTENLSQQGAQC